MSERAPYSRVYWTVRNDDRLAGIYSDDHHWATWNRLLLAADMAWPAPADLPANARRASLRALEAAGVIELLPGGLFCFHGLDTERGRRREAAVTSAAYRSPTGRAPNGDRTVPGRGPDASLASRVSRAEPSRAETSRAPAREGPDLDPEKMTDDERRRLAPTDRAIEGTRREAEKLRAIPAVGRSLTELTAINKATLAGWKVAKDGGDA